MPIVSLSNFKVKEELLDLIAGAQSSRLNEQRAPWAVLPGLTRSKQVVERLFLLVIRILIACLSSAARDSAAVVSRHNGQGLSSR